ncbi:hypothetical protein GOODEAATRI_027048 [Goodea atripinnis]|uniref:Uncharacterized protein n=1 Tax=Goodea atripinnis TaxID=208336 RepID=A0ABV0NY51_9TELE
MLTSYAAPCDVRGCTRATLSGSACVYPSPRGVGNPLNPTRDRDWGLQLFPMNEEFPVSAGHKLALIKSLPFVHTARRYYRLDGLVRSSDRPRRSEPAEGSLTGCAGPVPWAPSSGRSCGRDRAADDSERAEAGALPLAGGASPRRTPAAGSVGLRGFGVEASLSATRLNAAVEGVSSPIPPNPYRPPPCSGTQPGRCRSRRGPAPRRAALPGLTDLSSLGPATHRRRLWRRTPASAPKCAASPPPPCSRRA